GSSPCSRPASRSWPSCCSAPRVGASQRSPRTATIPAPEARIALHTARRPPPPRDPDPARPGSGRRAGVRRAHPDLQLVAAELQVQAVRELDLGLGQLAVHAERSPRQRAHAPGAVRAARDLGVVAGGGARVELDVAGCTPPDLVAPRARGERLDTPPGLRAGE